MAENAEERKPFLKFARDACIYEGKRGYVFKAGRGGIFSVTQEA